MEKYIFIKEIGSGSFGKVFLVKSKQQGINYVVKQVDLTKLDRKQCRAATKEVEVLAKLRHNNIVSYKESYEKNNQLNIVLEYCENGDLHDKIKEKRLSNKKFGENEILDYFVQICLALEYIHGQRILHRDLKTKNIFLTKGNIIKLGDFGIAKVLDNSFELAKTCIGSPFYVSPEICENKPYNKKSDVWALGCVLYELATLKYAFVAKNVKTLIAKILTGVYNPLPVSLSINIRTLISAMLKPNPKDRPSVREILEKRFLVRRRAIFICKAHKSGFGRRSKSGSTVVVNNVKDKNQLKREVSLSCLQLNQLEDNVKLNGISNPEAKYNPTIRPDKQIFSDNVNFLQKQNLNKHNIKSIKLSKVDSEYYDLIAAFEKNSDIKKDGFAGKQPSLENVSEIERNPESKVKNLENISIDDEIKMERIPKHSKFGEPRKRWMKNTLQREELLTVLNESELLEDSMTIKANQKPSEKIDATVDELLSFQPSEITDAVLLPIKLDDSDNQKENFKDDSFEVLQVEVKNLKKKFELDKSYTMDNLLKFTENCKKILMVEANEKYTKYDRKVGGVESDFYNLEYQRMELERKVGFCEFLKTYRKMVNIINDEFESDLKNTLENHEGTKTYVISRAYVPGDIQEAVKNTWNSILDILGDKQKYLPDIWELAMSENIYYHL